VDYCRINDRWRGEVLIVGGGPVGLLLANLLGKQGIRCAVVERRSGPLVESRAIGIMPPSLQVLERLDLATAFVDAGLRIDTAVVHDERRLLGRVTFCGLPGGYPFILSLPQADTVQLLRERLETFPTVRYFPASSVVGLSQSEAGVSVRLTQGGEECVWHASLVVGCDGIRSTVRHLAGIRSVEQDYGCSFLMGDFEDRTGLDAEAHLFFTARGSVESFPLSHRRRRWIVQTDAHTAEPGAGFLEDRIQALSGFDVRDSRRLWQSAFSTGSLVCRRYFRERVVLCGDAAHTMSPIGGQGMNTGFADAALLAQTLGVILRRGGSIRALFRQYAVSRHRAFETARRRAEWGMWMGTRMGCLMSALRGVVIKRVLLRPPVSRRLRDHFAMLTIPNPGLEMKATREQ
jgi:2-polyprenyl-6-methoxyphenol hydroxylase-like FAD-dependent oxidoreductase